MVETDRIDLIASYHSVDGLPGDEFVVFPEAIAAVCSPDFAATQSQVLARPVKEWGKLPFPSFAWPTLGWAAWDDWFETVGHPQPRPWRTAPRGLREPGRALANRYEPAGWRGAPCRQGRSWTGPCSWVMVMVGAMARGREGKRSASDDPLRSGGV